MTRNPRILVAADVVADAEVVRRLLSDEFDAVSVSSNPDLGIPEFDQAKPGVLVLAFKSLEKSERYYLGLYRHSRIIHELPHQTVILCGKDELRRVYELCRKDYFDDYVLFWPMANDATRLPMSVHQAMRRIAIEGDPQAARAELVRQARRIVELEARLAQLAGRGRERADLAGRSLDEAGRDIGAALDEFSHHLAEGGLRSLVQVHDRELFGKEFARLKAEQIEPRLDAARQAMRPVGEWAAGIAHDLASLDASGTLRELATPARAALLIVEDDEFQRQLLTNMLGELGADLAFATSGAQALGALRKRRPDLILMDIELPDIGGVDVVRRIKSVDAFARIPVVMVTGNSERAQVMDSLSAGAADFLVKPIERAILVAKLRRFLPTRSTG